MARLVGLPTLDVLKQEIAQRPAGIRIGQYVWNKYGHRGIDGEGWPELFYADDDRAITLLSSYYL